MTSPYPGELHTPEGRRGESETKRERGGSEGMGERKKERLRARVEDRKRQRKKDRTDV